MKQIMAYPREQSSYGENNHRRMVNLAVSEFDLCRWLGQARPGDVLQYHRGFLALDAVQCSGRRVDHDRAELGRVARRALWAAEKGLAHLVQRRHGPDDYAYLLIARLRTRTNPAPEPEPEPESLTAVAEGAL